MIYDRRFGLPQSMVNYLNQPLPDISGIFSSPDTSGILSLPVAQSEPIDNEEIESLTTTGLTPEQLALLYPQLQMGGGEGGYQDEDTTIGDGSTLGIDSFGDVIDFGKKNLGTIAATSFFGLPGLIGTGISSFFGSPTLSEFKKAKTFQEFFENQKAQKAAAAAKARASAIAQEAANRDAAREAAAAKAAAKARASAIAQEASNRDAAREAAAAKAKAAANREARRSSQYGGDNGGGGDHDGGASAGAQGDAAAGMGGY